MKQLGPYQSLGASAAAAETGALSNAVFQPIGEADGVLIQVTTLVGAVSFRPVVRLGGYAGAQVELPALETTTPAAVGTYGYEYELPAKCEVAIRVTGVAAGASLSERGMRLITVHH